MKYRIFAAALFVSYFLINSVYAQNQYYLSHVVNGDYGKGTYRMTFVLFNNTNTDTTAALDLTDNSGNPLVLTLGGKTASTFVVQLSAGASQVLQTDGQGNVVTGAAKVTSAIGIGVSAIFSIYDANGKFLTETGVGSSEPLSSFVLPVDTTGLFNTGLAIFNIAAGSTSVTMTLRDTGGQQAGSPVKMSLSGHQHLASFIAGLDQLFPAFTNFQGTLLVQCSAPVAALVLRQNSTPLSFTSLPCVSAASTKRTLDLAQVANGSFGDGSYKTSFLIFNISASPANVVLSLTNNDGNQLNETILGRGTQSSFVFNNLAAGASLFLQTDGIGPVATGAAAITSSVPIGACAVFTVLNAQGTFQTETGVGDSSVLTSSTLPVDLTGSFDTGIAFFAAGGGGTTLTFRLLDATGTLVGASVTKNISNLGHLAVFVSELFPGNSNFRGSLAVTSTTGVAALTLRENSSPLSFTTLPVVQGVPSGKTPPAAPLLSKIEMGITATSDITRDETLPSGVRLTGTVTGPGQGRSVTATATASPSPNRENPALVSSGELASYSGTVNRQTGKYAILLPTGTYTLQVGYVPPGVPAGQSLSVISPVAGSVQVSGDTTRDIVLPAVSLFNISGIVNGLSSLPTPSSPSKILFESSAGTIATAECNINQADGSYGGVLPSGTFTAGFSTFFIFTGIQFQSLGLLSLGTVDIKGNTTIPPFAVPAIAKLSGTIHGLGSGPFANTATIAAINATATVTADSQADLQTGQYQMLLPKNSSYGTTVATGLLQGSSAWGYIAFPLPASGVDLLQDTPNYDFTVPSLAQTVTISGHVKDGGGKPVNGVNISGSSDSITGGKISQFYAFGTTDAGGFYSIRVLSGMNYLISFSPPASTQ
jgi:hypothetical protein